MYSCPWYKHRILVVMKTGASTSVKVFYPHQTPLHSLFHLQTEKESRLLCNSERLSADFILPVKLSEPPTSFMAL